MDTNDYAYPRKEVFMKNILALLLGLLLTLALLFISFDLPLFDSIPTEAPPAPAQTQPATSAPTDPTTTDPTSTVPTVPTTNPTSPTTPIIHDLPMSAIALTEQAELSKDKDGAVYFTYAYPNVRLYLQNEAVSEAVTLDLLNRIDATREQANAVREDAGNAGTESGFYQVQYTPQRIDGAVLSLSGTTTSFSGGSHPGSTCTGITYDLLSGSALSLDDILTDNCSADVLCRLVVDALAAMNQDGFLYSDYAISVEERFSGNYLSDSGWYLSREGLCFSFEPYEVGPYSSGIITAVIPYGKLPGYLEDAWFPMEQISAQGDLIVESMSASSMDPYAHLAELNLDPSADAMVIHTDGLIYDITIQTTYPDTTVLFAADQMTPGSAIVLRGAASNLQILYRDGDEINSVPLLALLKIPG